MCKTGTQIAWIVTYKRGIAFFWETNFRVLHLFQGRLFRIPAFFVLFFLGSYVVQKHGITVNNYGND